MCSGSHAKSSTLPLDHTTTPPLSQEHYGGEDAHFTSDVGGGAMGVADGVGGWADSGVNPAEYSRRFMEVAKAYLEGKEGYAPASAALSPEPLVDPRGALNAAHMHTRVPGSATAVVMQLDRKTRKLAAANLGDSGFFVARAGRIAVKSKPLQHFFDCPLQFGAYPEYVEATDSAEQAELFLIPLQVGDVIVAGGCCAASWVVLLLAAAVLCAVVARGPLGAGSLCCVTWWQGRLL
jgi:protein phosphatase PTC7